MSLLSRLRGHFQEYVARYTVLALAILTPASGALGAAAARLGGADTQGGRIALAGASALATAIAGVTFLRNLGVWQMLDKFGAAPGVAPAPATKPAPSPGSTPATPPTDEDNSVLAPTDGLPSDASEANPPDPAPPPPPAPTTPAEPEVGSL